MPRQSTKEVLPSWSQQLLGLAGLLVTGALIAYFVPDLPNPTSGIFTQLTIINFHQLLALVLTVGAAVIFLAYARAKLLFSTRWLAAAVTYNVLILFVKFTLSTNEAASQAGKDFGAIMSTALLVSLLYIAVFAIIYMFFNGSLLNKTLHKALITTTEGKVILAMGLFLCATLIRIVAFQLPGLSGTGASTYVSSIFQANNTLLNSLLFVMIFAAVEAFAQVRRKVDLKYFAVTGVTMILSFHVWWAIFMYRGY